MNYLAHAYLSFGEPEILVGNLVSDFVKGKKKFTYSKAVQKGIILHRMIDDFTDSHSITAEAKLFFKPAYGLYSGAFIDIVYDHFLANDKNEFPDGALALFAKTSYAQLEPYYDVLPEKFQRMFHYMKQQDWLYHYQFKKGVFNSFAGLVARAKFMDDYQTAFDLFENHYTALRDCYEHFFPTLKIFSYQRLLALQSTD